MNAEGMLPKNPVQKRNEKTPSGSSESSGIPIGSASGLTFDGLVSANKTDNGPMEPTANVPRNVSISLANSQKLLMNIPTKGRANASSRIRLNVLMRSTPKA